MAENKRIELAHKKITILVTPELERIRQRIQTNFDERFSLVENDKLNPEEAANQSGICTGLSMALDIIDQETITKE